LYPGYQFGWGVGKDERREGQGEPPPIDDISQTRTAISGEIAVAGSSIADLKAHAHASVRRRREVEDRACEFDHAPLGEMAAEDFYVEGCDGSAVFIIPAADPVEEGEEPVPMTSDFIAEG
jgi:hypothetical protein